VALAYEQHCRKSKELAAALAALMLAKKQTCHAVVECTMAKTAAAVNTAMNLAVDKSLADLAASHATFLAALASAVAKAMVLAASALVETTCYAMAVCAEMSARWSLANESCCRELV
jgi:hypothetical protein